MEIIGIVMQYYSRKPTRIPGYDYSTCNFYFITICTYEKKCIFGEPEQLNMQGKIAEEHIKRIHENYSDVNINQYVVMPNHVHMIIEVGCNANNPSISTLIGLYKAGVTKVIRQTFPQMEVWQRSFHDHVIRNQAGYEKIWTYIQNNPKKWELDCFYVQSE
jgi:REP element-mobilizing transposase RayT